MRNKIAYWLLGVLLVFGISARAKCATGDTQGLEVQGTVAEIKLREETSAVIVFDIRLDLKFVNTGDRPIILLRGPHRYDEQNQYWLKATWLTMSPGSNGERLVYNLGVGENVSREPRWKEISKQLDQESPPAELTRILAPGESFSYQADTYLYIQKKGNSVNRKWSEIKNSPLEIQLVYDLWSLNISQVSAANHHDPVAESQVFARMLSARWQKYGELQSGTAVSIAIPLRLPNQ